MSRRRRLAIAAGAVALLIVVGVVAGRMRSPALSVQTVRVSYGRFEARLPETGQIQRPTTETLAALVGGNVGAIYVRPSQHVAAGQLLATIVNPQLESNAMTARAAYEAAASRALKTGKTLPLQNSSAVVQARVALQQAEQDLAQGTQSGLGYGAVTAQEQRLAADADVSRTQTDLREARRIADANRDLYANKAISKDALDQSVAKLEEAKVAADQALERRKIIAGQLARNEEYLRNRVRAQRDALRQAEANLAATQPGDVAAAEADAARAAADLQFAQEQIARMQIHAPFAGIVQNVASQANDPLRPLQPGDAVTVGQALITLATDEPFVVRTKVDEQDVAAIAVGQRAIVSGEAFGSRTLPGRVTAISAYAQKSDDPTNTSRQILTTVRLQRSLPFLRDGMTVDVDIVTVDEPHVLTVPTDAVRRDAKSKPYVFVLRNGRAQRVEVRLGASNDSSTIVRRGLNAGDVVVADKNPAIVADAAVVAAPSAKPSPSPR
ncbi:MAG: efflux RND transporter periplasmic adaptor subunit [Candidatus Eremiobacteraeota bacterium]|nr:efflux RND transporter periplasmic adaptor subunit [Candidatus Eremiobacteraeota bacterium]